MPGDLKECRKRARFGGRPILGERRHGSPVKSLLGTTEVRGTAQATRSFESAVTAGNRGEAVMLGEAMSSKKGSVRFPGFRHSHLKSCPHRSRIFEKVLDCHRR